ncbi:MAG: T9SS type A sorting domain-containing protein [Methanococcaceae archaeon]
MKLLTGVYSSRLIYLFQILLFFLTCSLSSSFSQGLNIKGNITCSFSNVYKAKVTFVNETDTTRKFSSYTDTLGYFNVYITPTSVKGRKSTQPSFIELAQNYPNPFSNETIIPYKVEKESNLTIRISNILGQEVRSFAPGEQLNGIYSIKWDGRNNFNEKVSPGIYICQLISKNENKTIKMIYSTGSLNAQIPLVLHFNENSNYGRIKKSLSSETDTYTMLVENCFSTKPRVKYTEYPGLKIQKDTTMNLSLDKEKIEYSVCYQKNTGIENWEIYLNTFDGTNPKTISNSPLEDGYPEWSPDGKYISYQHQTGLGNTTIYLYDVENDKTTDITEGSLYSAIMPKWTPDGKKLFFNYLTVGESYTAIINMDGTGLKKINDNNVLNEMYFYPDSYNFVYIINETGGIKKAHKTNIDNTYDEIIFEPDSLELINTDGVSFNPLKDVFLFIGEKKDSTRAIMEYNIRTNKLTTLLRVGKYFDIFEADCSNDYSQIICAYKKSSSFDEDTYLSVISEGISKELWALHNARQYFDYHGPKFSPKNRYLAIPTIFVGSMGGYVVLFPDLYLMDLSTGEIKFLDDGENLRWNPNLIY